MSLLSVPFRVFGSKCIENVWVIELYTIFDKLLANRQNLIADSARKLQRSVASDRIVYSTHFGAFIFTICLGLCDK